MVEALDCLLAGLG